MSRRWQLFADLTRDAPPRELLVRADRLVAARDAAIDVGSGALNETRFLLDRGYREVTALDLEPLRPEDARKLPAGRVRYVRQSFDDFAFPVAGYDLVNAQYALQFIRPTQFNRVFGRIRRALRPRGIFAGQLLGEHDDWYGDPSMNFHSRRRARALFDGMEVLVFEEEDIDDKTADGAPKHWHVFHVIARK
jgi:SAM-dependent methyltransferase